MHFIDIIFLLLFLIVWFVFVRIILLGWGIKT
jgi:hypothetical protein